MRCVLNALVRGRQGRSADREEVDGVGCGRIGYGVDRVGVWIG